jgi:uncharacterized protein YecT (DUF1311 family)
MAPFVLAVAASVPAHSAPVANGCDGPKTGFDNVYCFAKVYMELDHQLNANYGALLKKLSVSQQSMLKSGQRQWIAARDKQCLSEEGGNNTVNIDCAIGMTRRRVQFLSDRAAECAAHGCLASKLANVE